MIKVTHKGFTLTQNAVVNNHFMITDSNNKMRMHSECERKLTEQEAVSVIEHFIEMYDKFEQIWSDEDDKA